MRSTSSPGCNRRSACSQLNVCWYASPEMRAPLALGRWLLDTRDLRTRWTLEDQRRGSRGRKQQRAENTAPLDQPCSRTRHAPPIGARAHNDGKEDREVQRAVAEEPAVCP